MSAYLDAARISENQGWTKRINMIGLNAAVDVMGESDATAQHASRVALARMVIAGNQTATAALPKLVMTNEVVRAAAVADLEHWGAAVLDSDLEYVVATIWTAAAISLTGA
jgi:hypothetical protein